MLYYLWLPFEVWVEYQHFYPFYVCRFVWPHILTWVGNQHYWFQLYLTRHQGAYFRSQPYARPIPMLDEKQRNNPQTNDIIGKHENPRVSIMWECKCNFCGFCLPKHFKKQAKKKNLLFSLRAIPFAYTCIQQSHILSLLLQLAKWRYSRI
jgi:hypothetical protein